MADNDYSKYKNEDGSWKSPEEIAQMHQEAEALAGRLGSEVGTLRTAVNALDRRTATGPVEVDPATQRTSRWRELGSRAVMDPEQGMDEFAEGIVTEAENRAARRAQAITNNASMLNQFMTNNPKLQRYPEIVAATGDMVFRQHPDWSMDAILAETKRLASEEILSLKKRMREEDGLPEPTAAQKAAMTTSSGSGDVTSRAGEVPAAISGETRTPVEREAIAAEIASLRNWRKDRATPPRSTLRK